MTTGPNTMSVAAARARLARTLLDMPPVAVAVSGGVDSMTLAFVAHVLVPGSHALHAVSPAVPASATERVRAFATREGWDLRIIDAREFADERYRANPVDRCFHCKTRLYSTIAANTDAQVVSGANLSDLGEYRPGLDAARDHRVRHPFVEAGIDKPHVRAIARELGLGEIAGLPASPCLSSRVETGIRIEPAMLGLVADVERLVAEEIAPGTVRCRIRREGVVVELDLEAMQRLGSAQADRLRARIGTRLDGPLSNAPVRFEPYRNGSAFVHD